MATELGETYASDWLLYTASSGTFYKASNTNEDLLTRGTSGVPTKWVIREYSSKHYDINGDDKVNAADVVELVDYIMHHKDEN